MLKAFHIIVMVAWFAGLFYLPRLFVYHTDARDRISFERFICMEKRLYYGIMWPSALLTSLLGIGVLLYSPGYYLHAHWMHAKLLLVLLLWGYHFFCGYYVKKFSQSKNKKGAIYFRIFNEIPLLFLVTIVLLVVVKPF